MCSRFDLLATGCAQLNECDHGNDEEEDHGLGLADALETDARVERVNDVQSNHLGHVERLAVRQCEVLVVELERVGERQEQADGDRRHDHRDGHVTKNRPLSCAINFGCFNEFLRNTLKTGDVDDHHVADHLPVDQDDQTDEAVGGIGDQGGLPVQQDCVQNCLPGVAQDDAADQVRHEEDGTEEVRTLELAGQCVCDCECKHVDRNDGNNCDGGGEDQSANEALLVAECVNVVLNADKRRVGDGCELREGQVQTDCERGKECQRVRKECGSDEEQPKFLKSFNHEKFFLELCEGGCAGPSWFPHTRIRQISAER
ncbi:Uncharacterised protein [Chlamydia trachomatis]|nr:Uncharacterised protein [Chlamydia trachomatis]